MKYLLDTCTVSYFVRGEQKVLEQVKNTVPNALYISSISVMEIEYGLKSNPKLATKIAPIINSFLDSIHILPYTDDDARLSGQIRATLKKQGTPIGAYDILLAGVALRHHLLLVTSNTKEFSRIAGLQLADWRD